MKRTYCLYRVSDLTQVEKNDIPMQKIACMEFAERQGWEIVREFSEKGISGYKVSMKKKDALAQIREDAYLRKFDILLVFMFDRIGRRDDETPFTVEWLVHNGIEVWSVCEGEQRFDNHVDKLTNYIRYWQAAGESQKISERTRTRIRQLTEAGFYTGEVRPYGYNLVRGTRLNKKNQTLYDLHINNEEAEVVRTIFQKIVEEGYGQYRIANFLNESNIKAKSGKRWSPSTVFHILRNELYTGILRKGESRSPIIKDLKIIDNDTFTTAQDILNQRSSNHPDERKIPNSTKGVSLLSGFLFCGHCGARMGGSTNTKTRVRKDGSISKKVRRRYVCYRSVDGISCDCDGPNTYDADKIDSVLIDMLCGTLDRVTAMPLDKIIEQKYQVILAQRRGAYEQNRQALKQQSEDYELLKNETIKGIRGEKSINIDLLNQMLEKVSAEIQDSSEAIKTIEEELSHYEELKEEVSLNCHKYADWSKKFRSATTDAKKMILSRLIEHVEVRKDYELKVYPNPNFEEFLSGLL